MKKEDFLKVDLQFVMKMLKQGGAGASEKQEIFRLYKKYIDPAHLQFIDSNCSSCSSSIQMMWTKLKEYVTQNSGKFIY